MRLFLLLPLLAAVPAYAGILGGHYETIKARKPQTSSVDSLGIGQEKTSPSQNEKRAPRKKCSCPVYSPPLQPVRRSLERVEGDGPNSTRAELLSYKDSIFWDHPPRKPGDVEDMNTAVFQALQGQAKSVGAEELCGCTVLAIVSRTGIYMAHYWENIAFAPDPDWVEEHGSVEKCFENTVISPLKDGAKGPIQKKKIAQVSLQSKAAEFNKDDINIKAYLLVPSKAFDDAPETYKAYRAKWKKIRKTVGEMIPALKEGTLKNPNPLWTEITYEPLEVESGALQFTAAGRILFKYDPDHEGKKKSLMWVEGDLNPKHEDQW